MTLGRQSHVPAGILTLSKVLTSSHRVTHVQHFWYTDLAFFQFLPVKVYCSWYRIH